MSQQQIPIDVRHLFKSLDEKLLALLEALSEEEWSKQTVAVKWNVKHVASHLLDGNLRALSMQRDGYFSEKPSNIQSYEDLVNWLNQLNADWVKAANRISPKVLIELHRTTGPVVSEYFASLDPWKQAVFSVDWAGESTSYNWMHLAREYSEKWHHQQQIRDATNRAGIMTKEFFYPAISTFFLGLPQTFSKVKAKPGTTVKASIPGDLGGNWYLVREPEQWALTHQVPENPTSTVEIRPEISWKLFTKSIRPDEVLSEITISGDQNLGRQVLEMVSVMA